MNVIPFQRRPRESSFRSCRQATEQGLVLPVEAGGGPENTVRRLISVLTEHSCMPMTINGVCAALETLAAALSDGPDDEPRGPGMARPAGPPQIADLAGRRHVAHLALVA